MHQRHLYHIIRNLLKNLIICQEREGTLEVVKGTIVAILPAHIALPFYCEQRRSSLRDAYRVDSMPTRPPPDLVDRATGVIGKWVGSRSIVGIKANGAVII